MNKFSAWFRIFSNKPMIKFGLPFILLTVGGSFGLEQFARLRYQYSKKVVLKPEDVEPYGLKMKKPEEVTLETEYEKIVNMDIDTWENIRGPRPWEEQPSKK